MSASASLPKRARALKPLLDALHCRLVAEGLVQGEPLGWTGGAIPVGGLLTPTGKLGDAAVLLAGDAAGLVNPITGAGIAAAVISGRLAGATAARAAAGDQGALDNYAEEIEDRFAASLARALRRRQEIIQRFHSLVGPSNDDLRRGWIAFPEYWAA